VEKKRRGSGEVRESFLNQVPNGIPLCHLIKAEFILSCHNSLGGLF
jgi:hypothetical protein